MKEPSIEEIFSKIKENMESKKVIYAIDVLAEIGDPAKELIYLIAKKGGTHIERKRAINHLLDLDFTGDFLIDISEKGQEEAERRLAKKHHQYIIKGKTPGCP